MALAAGEEPCTVVECIGDMRFDFFQRSLIDERALFDTGAETVAHLQLRHLGGEAIGEAVVDRILHEHPVGADAGLPGVAVFACYRARHGGVEIGVVEHDVRRIAAEFERDVLQRACA